MPDYTLTVTAPFGDYARGDRIADPAAIAAVLETHPHNVVRVAAPAPVVTPAQEG